MDILKSKVGLLSIALVVYFLIWAVTGTSAVSPEALMLAPFMLSTAVVGQALPEPEPGTPAELKMLLEKQNKSFSDFREANDKRLKEIEEKGAASAETLALVKAVEADLKQAREDIEEVNALANRASVTTLDPNALSPEHQEHKDAFGRFIRKGNDENLREIEKKAFTQTSDPDGGYLIPVEMDNAITRVVGIVSAIRRLADVRSISAPSLKFRAKTSGAAGRWLGQEGGPGGETANAKYAQMEITAEELEAEPWAFNSAMEDATFDVASDLADEAGITFGEMEALAFITGSGVAQPKGFLSEDIVLNSSYAWGSVGYTKSGGAAGFAASNPADNVINLIHSLKSQYRTGSVLVMNDVTMSIMRQFKDASGAFYLFNPDPSGQMAGTILGVPVAVDDNMPALGANAYPVALANWNRAYRIVDRSGIALIRDNITLKGTTKFNFRKRVGGGIKNFEAIKLLKCEA